ncbi:MerR family transcriptional regulator [Myxococcaceae bacterium JPH2]|nr:MerR family transcriptional regulator [Myxococcaceae bacterium JPH2]
MSTRKTQTEWKLAELAEAAEVSPRTVRYYVQRGLLSAPPFRGPDTVYTEEHLVRLKAIRVLQARFLPLDAIQAELTRLTPEALRTLSESDATTTPPHVPASHPMTGASKPHAPPRRGDRKDEGVRYQRWELAPGLELQLADGAEPGVRALAERVRAFIEESQEREKP